MSHLANENILTNRHYVTLILRLTLDHEGRLIQGALVDTTDTLQQRFTNVSGLNRAMEAWLRQQEQTQEFGDP